MVRRLSRTVAQDSPPLLPLHLRIVLWFALLVFVIGAVLWITRGREVEALTPDVRANLGGTYILLSDGVTRFELSGPPGAPVIVLVHGGTLAGFIWDYQVEALREAGFRVLRYDAYGRGLSDRPRTEYNLDLYVRQLRELLDRLNMRDPVHMAGLSQGGLVAAAFSARNPHRVKRLSLIAPLVRGVPASRGVLGLLAQVPGISNYIVRVVGMPMMEERAMAFFATSRAFQRRFEKPFRQQLRYYGFERSFLSLLRHDMLSDQRSVYEALGRENMAVQLIWGTEDKDIGAEDITLLRDLVPDVTYREIKGADHGLILDERETVNDRLIAFHSDG